MRRMAIVFSVLAVGMLVLGIVEDVTNFRWATGDQNPLFGNPKLLLNDGKVVLILAGFLAIASALMWFMVLRGGRPLRSALRKGQSDQR